MTSVWAAELESIRVSLSGVRRTEEGYVEGRAHQCRCALRVHRLGSLVGGGGARPGRQHDALAARR